MISSSEDPERLGRALRFAAELHRGQIRKGTQIPYLSHLLAVAALVAEDGGDEDQLIAGLLHDTAEDHGGEETLALISDAFGGRVARIVRDCSDSLTTHSEQKAPWCDRKTAAVARLSTIATDALTVIAADKLHNMRCTLTDLRLAGDDVWLRFKTGKEGFVWYHEQVLASLLVRVPDSRSVVEMSNLLPELRRR